MASIILLQYLLQLSDQCLQDLSTKNLCREKKRKKDIFDEKKTFNNTFLEVNWYTR